MPLSEGDRVRANELLAELGILLRRSDIPIEIAQPLAVPAYNAWTLRLTGPDRTVQSAIELSFHLSECVDDALRLIASVTSPDEMNVDAIEDLARAMVLDTGGHLVELARLVHISHPVLHDEEGA